MDEWFLVGFFQVSFTSKQLWELILTFFDPKPAFPVFSVNLYFTGLLQKSMKKQKIINCKPPSNPLEMYKRPLVLTKLSCIESSTKVTIIPLTHFQTMFHFYTPLKTSENLRFSYVFRGYRSGTLVESGLKTLSCAFLFF